MKGSHAMHQEALDLLLTRRSVKPAMLGEPGPDARRALDHPYGGSAGAGSQEARALALHRLRRRGAGRVRPRAASRPARPRRRSRPRRAGSRSSAPGCCGRPRSSPSSRASTPKPAGAGVGAGALLRRGLPEPVPGRQRHGLRHLLDHRVVRLQRRRARRARARPPTRSVAGFVYIGTAKERQADRERPDLGRITSRWSG